MRGALLPEGEAPVAGDAAEATTAAAASGKKTSLDTVSSEQRRVHSQQQVKRERHVEEDKRLQQEAQQTFQISLREEQQQQWSFICDTGGLQPLERWWSPLSGSQLTEQRQQRGGKQLQKIQEEQERRQVPEWRLMKPRDNNTKVQRRVDGQSHPNGRRRCPYLTCSLLFSALIVWCSWPSALLLFSSVSLVFSFKRHTNYAAWSLIILLLNLLILPSCLLKRRAEATTRNSSRSWWSLRTRRVSPPPPGAVIPTLLLGCPVDAGRAEGRLLWRRERPAAAAAPGASAATSAKAATIPPTVPLHAGATMDRQSSRLELRQAAARPSGIAVPGRRLERTQRTPKGILKLRAAAKTAAQATTSTAARSPLEGVVGAARRTPINERTILSRRLDMWRPNSSYLCGGTLQTSFVSLCTLLSSTSLPTVLCGVSGLLQVVASPSGSSHSVVASRSFLSHTSQTPSLHRTVNRTLLSLFPSHPCVVASPLSPPWASLPRPYGIHRHAPRLSVDYQTALCTSGSLPSFHSRYRISMLFRRSCLFFSSSRKGTPRTAVSTVAEGVSDAATGSAGAMAYLSGLQWSLLLPVNRNMLKVLNCWPRWHRRVAMTSLHAKNLAVGARLVVTETRIQVTPHALLTTAREPWSKVKHQSRSFIDFVPFLQGGEERKPQEVERQGNATPFRIRDAANKHNAGQKKGIFVHYGEGGVSEGEYAISPVGSTRIREAGRNQEVNAMNPANPSGPLGTTTASTRAATANENKVASISVQCSHFTIDPSFSTNAVEAEKAIGCADGKQQPSLVRDKIGSDCLSVASGSSSAGEAISGRRKTLTNRQNIGERRRLDRRLNWFKQYPYAPEHPAASRKGKGVKMTVGDLPSHGVSAEKQVLPSRPLPHSLRWKVLAETPAPAAAAAAAAAAATQAALDVVESSTTSAKRRKSKKKLKKQALARAAVAAAAAAQKIPGSAALVAAARWLQSAQLQKSSAVECAISTSSPTAAPTTEAVAVPGATAERLSNTYANEASQLPPSTGAAAPESATKQREDPVAKKWRRQIATVADAKKPTSLVEQADISRVSLAGQKGSLKQVPLAAGNKENLVGTPQADNVSGLEEQHCPSLLALLYPSKHAAYPPQLAFFVMKQLVTSKFNESVELHVQLNLGSGPRGKARMSGATLGRVRGYVTLPHGTFGELAELARSERQRQQEDIGEMQVNRNRAEEEAFQSSQDGVLKNQGDASHLKTNRVLNANAEMPRKEESQQSIHFSKETARQRQQQIKGSTGAEHQQGHELLEEQMKGARGVLPVPGGSSVLPAVETGLQDKIFKEETGIVRGRKKGGVWRRRRIIAAFVDRADEKAAIQAGADIVGVEKIVSLIRDDAINFDVLISTPDMVARLTRYGKILGPKNLLPQDAWGTLSADFCGAIRLYRQTTVPYKSDKFNIVHLTIGHASMPTDHLVENLEAAMHALHCSRPPSAGSNFFYKVHISSTMGPGILIDMKHVRLTASGKSIM